MEFKGTKGCWYIERTSNEDSDFQCRILSNVGKVYHAGTEKDQIMIIAGEPTKQNGYANIHSEANAKLLVNSLIMYEHLEKIAHALKDVIIELKQDSDLLDYIKEIDKETDLLIKEISTI